MNAYLEELYEEEKWLRDRLSIVCRKIKAAEGGTVIYAPNECASVSDATGVAAQMASPIRRREMKRR